MCAMTARLVDKFEVTPAISDWSSVTRDLPFDRSCVDVATDLIVHRIGYFCKSSPGNMHLPFTYCAICVANCLLFDTLPCVFDTWYVFDTFFDIIGFWYAMLRHIFWYAPFLIFFDTGCLQACTGAYNIKKYQKLFFDTFLIRFDTFYYFFVHFDTILIYFDIIFVHFDTFDTFCALFVKKH